MSTLARACTLADITPEWVSALASVLGREGQAYDLAPDALSLRIQSINTGQWMPLNLPTNGTHFDTPDTARAVYSAIFAEITRLQVASRR